MARSYLVLYSLQKETLALETVIVKILSWNICLVCNTRFLLNLEIRLSSATSPRWKNPVYKRLEELQMPSYKKIQSAAVT